MTYAPIVVFGFNRPDALKNTIASLLRNEEAKDSDLFVFVDGPREGKVGEKEKVEVVREYVKSITGFKSLHYTFAENNKGLADSIIGGVSEVINLYGKVIVLEDDLVLMPNFLNFLNQGLDYYENNQKVMSVCGHSCKVKTPPDYPYDAYFFTRSSSWGWATWKDRWDLVDWKLNDWDSVVANRKEFIKSQGSDVFKMLRDCKLGKNHSWAIRFCYAQFVQNRLSVIPNNSLVDNEGFGGDGTNCKRYSRFKFQLNDRKEHLYFRMPSEVKLDPSLYKQALWYHSIPLRIWSRIMYILKK